MTQIKNRIAKVVELIPTEKIHEALGANHDIVSGIDELIDNSIDAGSSRVAIIFHINRFRVNQITFHDDGVGMTDSDMLKVLRIGGREARSENSIGRYGIGMKEGSFSNANVVTISSKKKGSNGAGYELKKGTFSAGELTTESINEISSLRKLTVFPLENGTTIVWNDLTSVYKGSSKEDGEEYISSTLERIRKHAGIRYHRFLESKRLVIELYTQRNKAKPKLIPSIEPINPSKMRKSPNPQYPLLLTENGNPTRPGVTAHIWTNRSKNDEFNLGEKSELGHQGFYFYDADRLLTQGGWFGYRTDSKDLKLLRIVVDDPEILKRYVTVSPQKGSVQLGQDFHRFMAKLKAPSDKNININSVFQDSISVVRESNRRSSNPDPVPLSGKGMSPAIQKKIKNSSHVKASDPVNVLWKKLSEDQFFYIDRSTTTIYLNNRYRQFFNHGHRSQKER